MTAENYRVLQRDTDKGGQREATAEDLPLSSAILCLSLPLSSPYLGAGALESASAYAVTAITAAFSPSSRGFTLSKVSAGVW